MMSTRAATAWPSIYTDAHCHTSRRYSNLPQNVAEKNSHSRAYISTNDVVVVLADDADWCKRG